MKSFLGLIGQFRDHVDHFGDLTAPLYELTEDYKNTKSNKIHWTEKLQQSFDEVKKKVANCPKLFFIDDDHPIYLNTDASNIGIGAYLFQQLEARKVPIRFVSKALNKTERKWDTVEKEAFAIFFAFQKLKHLLHNRPFILQTDSKNLSYMNAENKSQKVQRWKLACQDFDFKVQHIPGVDNIEADSFSRLVSLPSPDEESGLDIHSLELEAFKEEYKISDANFEKIKSVHGGPNGHLGVQRTIQAVLKKYKKWPTLRKDVRVFLKNCYACQKMKQDKTISFINPFTLATVEPMQRVYVDTIGPINSDQSVIDANDGFNYVLVMIDAFSRFIQVYPTKSTTAQSALYPFSQWIANFGAPSELITDNGTQFANELISQFCDLAAIDFDTIHAYSKEENAMVERANKEVFRHLIPMINDKQSKNDFVKFLPFAQRIINTMEHATLKVSPSQIIFGNSLDHDAHFLTKPKHNTNEFKYSEHMENMLQTQERFIKIAQMNQLQDDRLKIARRQVDKETNFPINSYVLVEYETGRKPDKGSYPLHGPYQVIGKQGSVYTVRHLVTNKSIDFHAKIMREFHFDERGMPPEQTARLDKAYKGIKKVIGHRFTNPYKKWKSNLEFNIIWDDQEISEWTPWNKSLGEEEMIHNYLSNNKLARFIPQRFTWGKDHPNYEKPLWMKKRKNEN